MDAILVSSKTLCAFYCKQQVLSSLLWEMLWAVLRNEKGLQADAHSPDDKLYLCNAQVIEPAEFLLINALQGQLGSRYDGA